MQMQINADQSHWKTTEWTTTDFLQRGTVHNINRAGSDFIFIIINFSNWTILNNLNSQLSELPLSQCFGYPDHTCVWGYSLLPSGLIEIKRKSFNCIFFFLCVPMPIYRVLLWLKFSAGSGHIIKCLLMWVWFSSCSWSKDLAALGP